MGSYFFYDTTMRDYIRMLMSWFTVGAEVGGLAEILFILLGPIAYAYNDKFKTASFINKFHFRGRQTADGLILDVQ